MASGVPRDSGMVPAHFQLFCSLACLLACTIALLCLVRCQLFWFLAQHFGVQSPSQVDPLLSCCSITPGTVWWDLAVASMRANSSAGTGCEAHGCIWSSGVPTPLLCPSSAFFLVLCHFFSCPLLPIVFGIYANLFTFHILSCFDFTLPSFHWATVLAKTQDTDIYIMITLPF